MVKVAFVFFNFDVGGTELNAVRTAEALDRDRFDLRVIALSDTGPLLERYHDAGIPSRIFPVHSLVRPHAVWQALRLVRYLRQERIDVVHTIDMYGNIFGVPCARLAGVPKVLASRRWWKRGVERRVLRANRTACRMAHRVVGNSEAVGRFLVEEDGVRPDRVTVITNFLEDAAFETPSPEWTRSMRLELGLESDDVVVGVVARLVPVKDHETLVRAMAPHLAGENRARLVLVGDGPERPKLESLAKELGIEARVRFAGQRPRSPSFHHLFDLSVLSSVTEGFPNTVLEAMAAGKAMVATSVGGTPDAVRDGETGLLVSAGDVEALSGALGSLIDDPELRERMGEAGRARARSVYAQGRVLPNLEGLYDGSAESRSVAAGTDLGAHTRAVA